MVAILLKGIIMNTHKHYVLTTKNIQYYGRMYGVEFFGDNSKHDAMGFDSTEDARRYAEDIVDRTVHNV